MGLVVARPGGNVSSGGHSDTGLGRGHGATPRTLRRLSTAAAAMVQWQ